MKYTHVAIRYFKEHGKYYSEGELDLPHVPNGQDRTRPLMFHEVLKEVAARLMRGERPGLVDATPDQSEFHVLVTVYTEYGPLQALWSIEHLRQEYALIDPDPTVAVEVR